LLNQLETLADLVVVDTPAALAVSDPLPLLTEASGVVMVARVDSTRREAIRRLQRMVVAANGTLLGVVATATSRGPGHGRYDYGYEVAPNGRGGARSGRVIGRLRARIRAETHGGGPEFAAEPPKSSET
jgi:Mrp family chromosome partitioning ATPase